MPDNITGVHTATAALEEEVVVVAAPAYSERGARLEIAGLRKAYGKAVAVENVDLTVEPGEFLTLLGPSGSGKTTTLNIVAGFVDATEGIVSLNGKRVEGVPAHKRNIGMVFQSYALFPHMTVAKNVAFPLRQRRVPKAKREIMIREALATVRLEGYADRYPGELSGGQQQRVALARAMVFQPGLLLLDEPLGALDKALREWLQLELKRIHREVGCTFIYVTHDQEEALVLSDRIAIFNEGHIEQVGTSKELYEDPASLFVGSFMGKSSVFRGKASVEAGVATLTLPDGSEIRGTLRHGFVLADDAAILVRPERLDLVSSEDDGPSDWNRVKVTVSEITYLGGNWQVNIVTPDGGSGVILTSKDVDGAFSIGDTAFAVWDSRHGVVLDDSPVTTT